MDDEILEDVKKSFWNLLFALPKTLSYSIEDIKNSKIKIDPEELNNLVLKLIEDISGKGGFLNSYFSHKNSRYLDSFRWNVHVPPSELSIDEIIPKTKKDKKFNSQKVPYTPIIPLAGGPDSGVSLRLIIEAYLNRSEKMKTNRDNIRVVIYSRDAPGIKEDISRAKKYFCYLKNKYPEIPLNLTEFKLEGKELIDFEKSVLREEDYLYGQELIGLWPLLYVYPSILGEESGIISSIDTSNLTEALLNELTNGVTGQSQISFLIKIPKTIVISIAEFFGVNEFFKIEDSYEGGEKIKRYVKDSNKEDTKEIFYAIDVVQYLSIIEKKSTSEIHEITGYGKRFIENTLSKILNTKRTASGGYVFSGNIPEDLDYCWSYEKLYELYSSKYVDSIKRALGL